MDPVRLVEWLRDRDQIEEDVAHPEFPGLGEDEEVREVDWPAVLPELRPDSEPSQHEGLLPEGLWPRLGEIADGIGRTPARGERPRSAGLPPLEPGKPGTWDTCAWYQPVHFFGHDWGIFVRDDCIFQHAGDIARMLPHGTPMTPLLGLQLVRSGFYVMYLHEQFHHRVESMGIRFFVVEGTGRYRPYKAGVYRPTLGTVDNLEEALASANAYRRLSDSPYRQSVSHVVRAATQRYLKWRFPFDPPGYDQAWRYLKDPPFDEAICLLHGQVQEALLQPTRPLSRFEAATFDRSLFPITSRIWHVVRRGQRGLLPSSTPYKSIGTREMEQLARARGWQVRPGAGKGSHIRLEKPGFPSITIPANRKDLSPGVLKACLETLGGYSLRDLPGLL